LESDLPELAYPTADQTYQYGSEQGDHHEFEQRVTTAWPIVFSTACPM
jgi:hypothetical protein